MAVAARSPASGSAPAACRVCAYHLLGVAHCNRTWVDPRGPRRNIPKFVWLGLLHSLSGGRNAVERQRGVRLVYGAVASVLGLEILLEIVPVLTGAEPALAATATLLRITAAAGLLVLVHNLYGQADAPSRSTIGMAMLALVATWGYDLNLFTLVYLDPSASRGLLDWRGVVTALTAPLSPLEPSMLTAGESVCLATLRSSRSLSSPSAHISLSWRSWPAPWVVPELTGLVRCSPL